MHSPRARSDTRPLTHTAQPPKEEPREAKSYSHCSSHEWSATSHDVTNAYKGGTVHIKRKKNPTFSARHPNSMRAALLLLATTVVANMHSKPPNVVTRWGTNPNVGNLEWGSESEFLTELLR